MKVVGFGGVVYVAVIAFMVLLLIGAVSVIVDVVRRSASGGRRMSAAAAMAWAIPQAALLLVAGIALLVPVNGALSSAVGILFVLALVCQVAYLFTIVLRIQASLDTLESEDAEERAVRNEADSTLQPVAEPPAGHHGEGVTVERHGE
jgi:UPF0716 family protein affecting phage T7 exclusion